MSSSASPYLSGLTLGERYSLAFDSLWDTDDNFGLDSLFSLGEGRVNHITNRERRETNPALRTSSANDSDDEEDEPEEKKALKKLRLSKVNLHKRETRKSHNTDEYENPSLIVRRGQPFRVTISFKRRFHPEHDKVILQFTTGPNPTESKRTLVRVPVKDSLPSNGKQWGARLVRTSGNDMTVEIITPAIVTIGRYKLYIETRTQVEENEKDAEYRAIVMEEDDENKEASVCILFNPFCAEDSCYMAVESEREEYVLNETGKIWVGSKRRPRGRPWHFGQFDEVTLSACLYLLDKAKISHAQRSSPTHVVRCISKMVNNLDGDKGVLIGRWAKDYPNGKRPSQWNGSVEILETFMSTKQGVKYGQCWVFSGVVTTLCRAVGIPTRSVTNFASAHDTDDSMTIDYHLAPDGSKYNDGHYDDSVWNFHVWNESWFKRFDLPAGHDGWQVHDATPQELSGGFYQCGPASVEAIKNGEVYLPYDTSFVFGEVNGDKVYWTINDDGTMETTSIAKSLVGKKISTKANGRWGRRLDLTLDYKFREGSKEERRVMKYAYQFGSRNEVEIYDPHVDEDKKLKFTDEFPDSITAGEDLETTVLVENVTKYTHTVDATFTSLLTFYTGRPTRGRQCVKHRITLQPGEKQRITSIFKADDYIKYMVAEGSLKVIVKAVVEKTKQVYVTEDEVELDKPEITFSFPREIKQYRPFELTMSFTNPLNSKLTEGRFSFEAGKATKPKSGTFVERRPVQPHSLCETTARMSALKSGKINIIASFDSVQLSDVMGEIELNVIP